MFSCHNGSYQSESTKTSHPQKYTLSTNRCFVKRLVETKNCEEEMLRAAAAEFDSRTLLGMAGVTRDVIALTRIKTLFSTRKSWKAKKGVFFGHLIVRCSGCSHEMRFWRRIILSCAFWAHLWLDAFEGKIGSARLGLRSVQRESFSHATLFPTLSRNHRRASRTSACVISNKPHSAAERSRLRSKVCTVHTN